MAIQRQFVGRNTRQTIGVGNALPNLPSIAGGYPDISASNGFPFVQAGNPDQGVFLRASEM
ncbi:MAG: hypothetical protein CAPSK01_000960 [Candidatus Accumulibacter vicinus]|uniref:Uncharacterized protein n=1 Tax=Candidatus Accumulibacter vicinus TaxID=2954382 RepID=A0A084Y441_9PROT|nr:MAG: hypothetical protein CAPSK01_000960 [Candidatus Accumulibacter vicinus]